MTPVLSSAMSLLILFIGAIHGGQVNCNSSTTGPIDCSGTMDICCQDYITGAFSGCCYEGQTCCAQGCLPDGYTPCQGCLANSSTICPPQGPVCCAGGNRCCFKDMPICCDDGLHCGSKSVPCPPSGSRVVAHQLGLDAFDQNFMSLILQSS